MFESRETHSYKARELHRSYGRNRRMETINNFTKMLAISVLAILLAACGSEQTAGAGDDEPIDSVPAADAETGPEEGFRRVTFTFSPEDVIEDVYQGDLTTFEVRSASGSETVVVGFLDDTGTIDIPNEIARGTIGVEAEFPDDEFCWWSGFHTTSNPASVITIDVELEAVCA